MQNDVHCEYLTMRNEEWGHDEDVEDEYEDEKEDERQRMTKYTHMYTHMPSPNQSGGTCRASEHMYAIRAPHISGGHPRQICFQTGGVEACFSMKT